MYEEAITEPCAALCHPIHMETKNCDAILWPTRVRSGSEAPLHFDAQVTAHCLQRASTVIINRSLSATPLGCALCKPPWQALAVVWQCYIYKKSGWTTKYIYSRQYISIYLPTYLSIYRMYVCMHACMYVCMHAFWFLEKKSVNCKTQKQGLKKEGSLIKARMPALQTAAHWNSVDRLRRRDELKDPMFGNTEASWLLSKPIHSATGTILSAFQGCYTFTIDIVDKYIYLHMYVLAYTYIIYPCTLVYILK